MIASMVVAALRFHGDEAGTVVVLTQSLATLAVTSDGMRGVNVPREQFDIRGLSPSGSARPGLQQSSGIASDLHVGHLGAKNTPLKIVFARSRSQ
jgi:hypothetical protein